MLEKLGRNKKGFTLAELLIVVAIIAVLVAIAIPAFTTSLQRSRHATDLANVRSAYAEAVANYLGSSATPKPTITIDQLKAYATNGSSVGFGSGGDVGKIVVTLDGNTGSFDYDAAIVVAAPVGGGG